MGLKSREFVYDEESLMITSNEEDLSDFCIRFVPKRFGRGISERWVFYWGDIIISFGELINDRDDDRFFKKDFLPDGRRLIIINKLGMKDQFRYRQQHFNVPAYRQFSSREQQDAVIDLFVEAMGSFRKVGENPGTLAVIGDKLQIRLDKGLYLPGSRYFRNRTRSLH